jgi:hypothetical protein
MSFQLLEIAIFNSRGEKRSISLRPNAVNIITGSSKSGKTALIDIVDYCLGRKTFTVPAGVIRDSVAWYVIRIQALTSQAVIGRPAPAPGAKTNSEAFLEIGGSLAIPEFAELTKNTNVTSLREYLTELAGIATNEHVPEGPTREPLSANITHAKYYLFQPQNRIADRTVLFYRQDEEYIPQAIRDTLPYFLGAVNEEHFDRMQKLRRARRDLKILERRLLDEEAIQGRDNSRALALLAEAQQAGIIDHIPESTDGEELTTALQQCASWQATLPQELAESPIEKFRTQREVLLDRLSRLQSEVATARAFAVDQDSFSTEVREQEVRLSSIALYDENDAAHICPLCTQVITDGVPTVDELGKSLDDLKSQMDVVIRQRPRLSEFLNERENEIAGARQLINDNRVKLESAVAQEEEYRRYRDVVAAQARVTGRISLFLDSVSLSRPSSPLQRQMSEAAARVRQLEGEISRRAVDARLESFLRIISSRMSDWARDLRLEHSEFPVQFDLDGLTVVAYRDDGPIPMSEMGSGENWVGYHVLTHLALHEWFSKKDRPVPRFLMLDQPTQVYFPADLAARDIVTLDDLPQDEDREAVLRLFSLIFDVVGGASNGLQVIITDHADLADESFQNAIIERWRGGVKLVPESWYQH